MKNIYSFIIALFSSMNLFAQSGSNCNNAIPVTPTAICNLTSYTTTDSVVYFSFIANETNMQIIGVSSVPLGTAAPHIHRSTFFSGSCSTLQTVEDEFLPDIVGANELVIDASNLIIGNTYYVRLTREPSRASAGCAPTPSPTGECHASMNWTFNFCIRSLNILIPKDFGLELPSIGHSYYTNKGQIKDVNGNIRFDINSYTSNSSPAVYCTDTAVSFVYEGIDTINTTIDTLHRVDMLLTGSNAQPTQRSFKTEKTNGYLNYFLAHVPNGVTNIKGYSRTVRKDVYPNIDMQFYSNNAGTKFYFVRNPGGNPNDIELQFNGATALNVTASGGLDIITTLGKISFEAGHAYAIDPGNQIVPMPWVAKFVQVAPNKVKFDIHQFPAFMPLIIQVDKGHSTPQATQNLTWSSYYGGGGWDAFRDVVTDASGNVYTSGFSQSINFPVTTGVIQDTLNTLANPDAIIVKFDSSNVRQWATYYGGNQYDIAHSVAVDGSGNVYMTGYTFSTNFPVVNAVQALLNGTGTGPDGDAFIVKLNPAGNTRLWATYYGGYNGGFAVTEIGYDMALDGLGNLYVVGGHNNYVAAPTIPTFTLTGAFNSNVGTAFILKFSTAGARLWATRIGGSGNSATTLLSCAVTQVNDFVVAGWSDESGWPIQNAGGNAAYAGNRDGVVTKFNQSGAIIFSTYYGGSAGDVVNAVAVDKSDTYFTGFTNSPTSSSIPLTDPGWPAYFVGTFSGSGAEDAFIAQFDQTGTRLWGTYFGSNLVQERGTSLAFDNNGDLFVIGYTNGSGLPLPNPNAANCYVKSSPQGGKDVFIATFNKHIHKWGTYFGGSGDDSYGIATPAVATYKNDNLYIVGTTQSGNTTFPLDSAGGFPVWYQGYNAGGVGDAFISKFALAPVLIASVDENGDDSEYGIIVYPNPSSQNITVEMQLTQKQNVEITLCNLLGENLYSETLKKQSGKMQKQISLSDFSSGIYILKIKLDDKIIGKKIIKQY